MAFYSTKTHGNDRGTYHSSLDSGSRPYIHCPSRVSLGFKLIFECDELDERNWVMDFGGPKEFKNWLEDFCKPYIGYRKR